MEIKPTNCRIVTVEPRKTMDNKVVIGDPKSKMEVAVVTFTCFSPLYQVSTQNNKNTDVVNIQENWFNVIDCIN